MRWIALYALLPGFLLSPGCDRAPAPPVNVTQEQTQQANPHPTTQELMSGKYVSIPLPGTPLAVQAPESWKIDMGKTFPGTFLVGPSPGGNVTIRVSSSEGIASFKQEQIDLLVSDAQEQQQKDPANHKKVELREIGPVKVLEKISLGKPASGPQVDARGNAMMDPAGNLIMVTFTPVHWTLTAFAPADGVFNRYELNFMDLTTEQYEIDKPFLEKVIRGVSYVGDAPTTARTR